MLLEPSFRPNSANSPIWAVSWPGVAEAGQLRPRIGPHRLFLVVFTHVLAELGHTWPENGPTWPELAKFGRKLGSTSNSSDNCGRVLVSATLGHLRSLLVWPGLASVSGTCDKRSFDHARRVELSLPLPASTGPATLHPRRKPRREHGAVVRQRPEEQPRQVPRRGRRSGPAGRARAWAQRVERVRAGDGSALFPLGTALANVLIKSAHDAARRPGVGLVPLCEGPRIWPESGAQSR